MKKAKAFSYSGRLRNIAVLGQVVETKDTSSINHKNIHFRRAVLETSYQTPLPKLLSTRCPKPSLTSSSQAGDLLAYDAVVTKPHWTCSMDGPDRRASRSIWVVYLISPSYLYRTTSYLSTGVASLRIYPHCIFGDQDIYLPCSDSLVGLLQEGYSANFTNRTSRTDPVISLNKFTITH